MSTPVEKMPTSVEGIRGEKRKKEELQKDDLKKHEELVKKCQKVADAKLNTEDFISEIEKHPCIWNCAVEEYSNKHVKLSAWNGILCTFIHDFEERELSEKNTLMTITQKRWKVIRGCYTREILRLKGIKSGSAASRKKAYSYFDQLRFLETSVKKTVSSVDDVDSSFIDEAENEAFSCHTSPTNVRSGSKRKLSKDDELVEVLKKKIALEESENSPSTSRDLQDDDKLFFLSMLPEVRKVPPERKLKLRSDMINLIAMAQTNHQQGWQQPPYHGYQQNNMYQQPPTYVTMQHHAPVQNVSSATSSPHSIVSEDSQQTQFSDLVLFD
ncbi:uncharacterized protein LOC124166791 [Ischnura elegans]|uniref:uncharacterized protein LOC124157713 n=1 Tax=Ischnura elegans TaxID=197161 RepID=UPI001ED87140|nr:uncharacterized protein LOC124157713 [Ischnura elegans]XP_046400426.1 uncharacterized protein LOC124166791 [Ischnura elegans]